MLNTETVNNAFTPVAARPVSHAAALAVLGSLAFVAHEGIVAWVPGKLGAALTVLFLAVAVLQWLGLGRREACAEVDGDRADAVITQAWIFGVIETVLYAAGGLALLADAGVAVYSWVGVGLSAVCSAALAFINFRIKWVSCDPVESRKASSGPTGGQRAHDVLFSTPAPELPAPAADLEDDETNIVRFLDRIAHTQAKFERDAKVEAARPAPVRLRNATKRIRLRAQRAAEKQVAAA